MKKIGKPIFFKSFTNKLYSKQRLYELEIWEGSNLQHVTVFNKINSDLLRLNVKISEKDKTIILFLEEIIAPLMSHCQRKQNVGKNAQDEGLYVGENQECGKKQVMKRNYRLKSKSRNTIKCFKYKYIRHVEKNGSNKKHGSSNSMNMVQIDDSNYSEKIYSLFHPINS
ncbi:hypothetical protein CR513_20451, partial [Mucuna pruriens]